MTALSEKTRQRHQITVNGIVQGVGFRPFIYGLAHRLDLAGFVRNTNNGVSIEIEGALENVDSFYAFLNDEAPPLARVDHVATRVLSEIGDERFCILKSESALEKNVSISPDTALCDACLNELFSQNDRRYRYPFINCTHCGPRFTIIEDVPYDRASTTMRQFRMCKACEAEYHDPADRRFHAQPNACPECGPELKFICQDDQFVEIESPVDFAVKRLAEGSILAIKGLGGYHLACDALNVDAVRRLRKRKHREEKPFALMVPDIETARKLCDFTSEEAQALLSRQSPITLLQRRDGARIAPAVAPGYDTLGIMLPYTPLHHVLLKSFVDQNDAKRLAVLVMTSGNRSEEPIAYRNEEAQTRLAGIADGFLVHNRPIHIRCDDSIVQHTAGGRQILRRARGFAPESLNVHTGIPAPILACGGHLKNTFCLGKGNLAYLSHHIGDLENLETLRAFQEGVTHFQRLFDIRPEVVAYDLHPEYLATQYALELDVAHKIGIQHHHAHIASVLAEHGLKEPVIGVAADGTGYGTDGAVWGGEIMVADCAEFQRKIHLAYMPMPGGERAILQPWRMAAVYLQAAFGDDFLELDTPFVRRLDKRKWQTMSQMIERKVNCPLTSSLGRLFDAVAALIGVRDEVCYEAQAAVELEMRVGKDAPKAQCKSMPSLEAMASVDGAYSFEIVAGNPAKIDVLPMIREMVSEVKNGASSSQIAGRFHNTIANIIAESCLHTRTDSGLTKVALSGGVFQNKLLLALLLPRLKQQGFQVYLNHKVPPNDGGLSFGQLAIAAARLNKD